MICMRSLIAVLLLLGDLPDIALSFTPHVGFAPLTIQAKVSIKPNYQNTGFCVEWASDDGSYDGASCQTLDGQYERMIQHLTLKHFPAGHYSIFAVVYRAQTAIQTPIQRLQVVP